MKMRLIYWTAVACVAAVLGWTLTGAGTHGLDASPPVAPLGAATHAARAVPPGAPGAPTALPVAPGAAAPGTAVPGTASPAPLAPVPAAVAQAITSGVDAALASSGLKRATIGVSVRDIATGQLLADSAGDRPMTPASNMKLLTTGAALQVLGADFVFRTRLLLQGDRLVVAADGDPAFGDPMLLEELVFTDAQGNRQHGLTVDALVDAWVDAARAAGISSVRELVVDDRIFDRQFVPPEWPVNQLGNAYCAEIAGLNFHTNLLHAFVEPSGGRAELTRWAPASPWLRVINKSSARTDKKSPQSIWVGRTEDAEAYTLNGNLRATPGEPIAVCVHDMPDYFARLLAHRLQAAGISVGTARVAQESDPKSEGTLIGPIVQTPLQTVLRRCNTDSQNLYAESLLKRIGAASTGKSGSWSNGIEALNGAIDTRLGAGTAARTVSARDGSGLSRDNKVAANTLTAWLRSMALDPTLRELYLDSLAIAGETGTVKKRFGDLSADQVVVRCKTGYINGVSCLSGVVGAPGQPPRYAFSVLCNDLAGDNDGVGKAKRLQERIVKVLSGQL